MSQEKHVLVPASYLLLRKGDQVLLARRFQTGYEDGKYSIPAGHVEPGETFTQTAVRESKEEIGVSVAPEDLFLAHVMQRNKSGDSDYGERMDMFFVTDKWSGEVTNMEPHKCDDLLWCAIDAPPENTIPYIVAALSAIQEGRFYSEFGY